MPTTTIYPTEQEWAAATTQALRIDPDVFDGFGKLYLVWGSMPGGAQVVLLGDDGFISPDTIGKTSVTSGSAVAEAYCTRLWPHATQTPMAKNSQMLAPVRHRPSSRMWWDPVLFVDLGQVQWPLDRNRHGPIDQPIRTWTRTAWTSTTQTPGGSYFLRSALNVSATRLRSVVVTSDQGMWHFSRMTVPVSV